MKAEELYAALLKATGQSRTVESLVYALAEVFRSSDLFYGHGTDNPDDEAYSLVFSVMGLDFDRPDSAWHQKVTRNQLDTLIALALRRINDRIPLPYLTGEAWFAGLRFYVDPRALVPRSPFAELIQNKFVPWLSIKPGMKILDLCTGNGCMGIAAAVYLSEARVDLVDLSAAALELSRKNVELHNVGTRTEVIQSDLFDALEGKRYDLIISNPPYVPASSIAELPVEYQHEPNIALQADDEGMAVVSRILQQADDFLTDEGVLIVEVGEIADMVDQHYQGLPFIWLEFEHGGEGVFLLNKQDLTEWRNGKSQNS